jgi:stage V sporulation protein R
MTNLLYDGNEWDWSMLERALEAVEEIGRKDLRFELYPNQVEIIGASQMLNAYSSHGMPIMYDHWSFGKRLIRDTALYKKGHMGLAYEIVVNTCPAIAYLMEENSATMQLLVLAHASVGHNFCFANNYMFREWTDADAIIDYLNFAKRYVSECESAYGVSAVEEILDSAHALMDHGVDKYRRTRKLNAKREADRQRERLAEWERSQTELWYSLDNSSRQRPAEKKLLDEPEENLLYFLEKHSPILLPWQREILRIVRKISQYWYPQIFTKVLNEGIATFTHHHILNQLYDQGRITDGHQLEWISSHANVINQPAYNSKHFSGINPYALGFAIFRDIQRMVKNPTPEDLEWFPQVKGEDWRDVIKSAATEYRDDSFVAQWLSPKVARDLKLFSIRDNSELRHVEITGIHNPETFSWVRQNLAEQYDHNANTPNIVVSEANLHSDRSLCLTHHRHNNRDLDGHTQLVLAHLRKLWGFDIQLKSQTPHGEIINTINI